MNASSLRYRPSFRFSAGHLIYAATLTAAAVALLDWYGVAVSVFVLIIWWQVLAGAKRESCLECQPDDAGSPVSDRLGLAKPELLIVLLIAGLLVGLLIPAYSDSDPMRHAEISMKMVARALKEYHNEYHQFPPPVLLDENNQPMHSWRALILPFLEEETLADAYRLDEPWNGPHNSRLAKYRPWHFREYYAKRQPLESETSMHMIACGNSRVLLEFEDLACSWLEPSIVEDEELARFQTVPKVGCGYWYEGFFSSVHRGRLAVSMSNTFQVHPSADLPAITSWLQSAHDTQAPIEIGQPRHHYHVRNAFHLAFFLAVALYPLHWLRRINRQYS